MNGRGWVVAAVALALGAGCTSSVLVDWTPEDVVAAIPPIGLRTAEVMAVRSRQAEVMFHLSPAIRPYIQVMPESLPESGPPVSRIRLHTRVPEGSHPGEIITGVVDARAGRRIVGRLTVAIHVVASTPEGTLDSLRAAIDARDAIAYADQFVPSRRQREREVFAGLTDRALDSLF